jgi:phage baseplate assembly protein W|tara:strand:- start:132 stop:548 length:417 start_codon:yes stop_codon:yes gene_type:complete
MASIPITSKDFKKSRSFKDLNIGMVRNPFTNDISTVTNEESIKQSIKNIVLTTPGEKLFNPRFGSRVSQLLFEQLDPFLIDSIQSEILNTISNYEPRVQVTELKCIPDYDRNSIDVTLQYQIIGLPLVETISFVLQRP